MNQAQSATRGENVGLQRSLFVKPNERVSPDSIFSDPVWKMKKLVTLPGATGAQELLLNKIPGYPEGFALAVAEYAYARMYAPIIDLDYEVEWLTVQNEVNCLRTIVEFFSSIGRSDFSQISKRDWKRLKENLKKGETKSRTQSRIEKILGVAYKVWDYRSRISAPPKDIPFGVSANRILGKGVKKGARENKTPCIPDAIFAALMTNALSYTQSWGATIVDVWLKVTAVWDELLRAPMSHSGRQKRLEIEVRKVLLSTKCDWRLVQWSSLEQLLDEVYHLRNAAMLVVLAFSGVRVSELLSIAAHCCISDKLSNGDFGWFLNTTVHKHKAGGKADTWVIVDEVVSAINILETLTQFVRLHSGKNQLFISNSHAAFGISTDFSKCTWTTYTSSSVIYQISAFVDHCSRELGRDIPLHESAPGKFAPWRFNSRQFRRTLARHIVRQPFGVIAGMLQYKHVSVATFEGYAGQEPEWNKMLEEEKILFDIDILGDMALDIKSGQLAGGLAQELLEEFQEEFAGQAIDASASQIAKWLESGSRTLHVGKLNLCLFDPKKAICTDKSAEAVKPILNACDQKNCGNACIGKKHLPLWQAQLDQTVDLIQITKRNRAQREILKQEANQIRDAMMLARSC